MTLDPIHVTEGEPATFRVRFTGTPAPVVKWYRYTFPIVSSKDFQINTDETSSSLTVAAASMDDSGIFTCLLENSAGATRSSTNLSVVEAGQEYVLSASTRTSRTLKEMAVAQGDKLRFDIQFAGGDKSKLEFFHDGEKIVESEEEGIKIGFEDDLATLTIERATEKHSGVYECLMRTDGGEAKCQITCKVLKEKNEE